MSLKVVYDNSKPCPRERLSKFHTHAVPARVLACRHRDRVNAFPSRAMFIYAAMGLTERVLTCRHFRNDSTILRVRICLRRENILLDHKMTVSITTTASAVSSQLVSILESA